MIRLVIFLFFLLSISGCIFDYDDDYHHGHGPAVYTWSMESYTGHADHHSYYSYGTCWDEPYYSSPDYCESYYSGECCSWYTGYGCYEEWCVWDHHCGWEYEGDFCY